MNKKIYIAGPMTGIKDFNYPKFFEVEEKLGLEVILCSDEESKEKGEDV